MQHNAGQCHGAFYIHKTNCSNKCELLVFRRICELILLIASESLGRLSVWHECCKRTAAH